MTLTIEMNLLPQTRLAVLKEQSIGKDVAAAVVVVDAPVVVAAVAVAHLF